MWRIAGEYPFLFLSHLSFPILDFPTDTPQQNSQKEGYRLLWLVVILELTLGCLEISSGFLRGLEVVSDTIPMLFCGAILSIFVDGGFGSNCELSKFEYAWGREEWR